MELFYFSEASGLGPLDALIIISFYSCSSELPKILIKNLFYETKLNYKIELLATVWKNRNSTQYLGENYFSGSL